MPSVYTVLNAVPCSRFALAFSTDAMFGKLSVDHTLKTLELLVSHVQAVSNGEESSTTQPMANLSGGERSRTLCTFMLALWEHVWTPFRYGFLTGKFQSFPVTLSRF